METKGMGDETGMDIQEALLALAELQEHCNATEDEINEALRPLEGQVNMLRAQKKANQQAYEDAVAAFKEQVLLYIQETSDQLTHISEITLRRTTRWEYDQAEALDWCKQNAPDALKVSLDKRRFESDYAAIPRCEPVNVPTLALSTRLGHLLINDDGEDHV